MASNSKTTKAKRRLRDEKLQKRRTRKTLIKIKKLDEQGKLVQSIL